MKINKWTLGLAAAGLVSLSPALLAQTPTPAPAPAPATPPEVPLMTSLSATTISGYVDTSAVWNPGTGNANPAPYAFNIPGKQDGFNVDVVDIKIAKPLDEGKWSAGYTLELNYGPDSFGIDAGAAPIREAHVDLGVPVGNGLDLQIGRFGNIIGYESTTPYLNPNWSHSYAWTSEPTEHTGILASYKFSDMFSLEAGVADMVTTVGGINQRNFSGVGPSTIESKKGIVSLLSVTAPDSWGFLKGSAFYAGFDYGPGAAGTATTPGVNRSHLYLGTTLNTPVKDLTFGASYDAVWHEDVAGLGVTSYDTGYFTSLVGYGTYKLTDKASINGRFEWAHGNALGALADANTFGYVGGQPVNPLNDVIALTGTFEYDLWANVVSRLEVRWDHAANGADAFGGTVAGAPTKKNDLMVGANVIYKF